jgi:hypothetical protein
MDKLPSAKGEGRVIEQNILTPAELRKAIDGAVEPWSAPITLAVFTGARQAEILGLRWPDIDWNNRTAEIRRQWRRGAFYEPKTQASRRTIELPEGRARPGLSCSRRSTDAEFGPAAHRLSWRTAQSGHPSGKIPRCPPLLREQPARRGGRCRHGLEGAGACECAHHARDLCPCDTEVAPRSWRCSCATNDAEWKQIGNMGLETRDSSRAE